ncbi:MAG TPA: hypothetical protein ENF93_00970, partial [Ignisphaera sp.]|nr:hypothetical protein [Ignisphaera sp.]
MPRKRYFYPILLLSVILFASLVHSYTYVESVKIWYFANELVYPNPGIPEPAIIGDKLELRFRYSENTKLEITKAILYNELFKCILIPRGVEWSDKWSTLNAYLEIPKDCREGLYSLEIEIKVNGTTKKIVQPNSVWLLKEWPKKIKLLFVADTKTPAGEPYWKTMARLANVLNPTLMIFGGDEVDRPTYASAWRKFLTWWLQLRIPAYAGIGNHEYDAPGIAKIWGKFFGYRNYTISLGKFLIILLDTGMEGWIPNDQLDWLENTLKSNTDKVKIVYMHHPLFSLRWKTERKWYFKIEGDLDKVFNYFLSRGYIYGSMADHPKETSRLFKLLLKYGVHLVLSGHIHQDLNVVLEYRGEKYYFITITGVPYDVPDKVPRGFRLIEIYENGTIVEDTLTCCGKGFADYPTDIPIDVGEKVIPYKLGVIEFYYTPSNDGTRKAVSFRLYNPINQVFRDVYIAFRVSKEVPLERYSITPKAYYEVYELGNYYLFILKNITIPPNSVVKYTIYATEDKEKPRIEEVVLDVPAPVVGKVKDYVIGYIKAYDDGWGVDEVVIKYFVNGEWRTPVLVDLDEDSTANGYVAYYFWIPSK